MSDLNIIFEDEHLLSVCKPAGLLSVPGKTEPYCLYAIVLDYNGNSRVIHRLDMATSGLVLFAKSHLAQKLMGHLFERREIRKTYHAVVEGVIQMGFEGSVDKPLICDWPNRPRQKICYQKGKKALTHYQAVDANNVENKSLVHLTPVTGRSHQLRVHMAHIKHPILGDQFYHSDTSCAREPRLMLHSAELIFTHPIERIPMKLGSASGFKV